MLILKIVLGIWFAGVVLKALGVLDVKWQDLLLFSLITFMITMVFRIGAFLVMALCLIGLVYGLAKLLGG